MVKVRGKWNYCVYFCETNTTLYDHGTIKNNIHYRPRQYFWPWTANKVLAIL